MFRNIARCTASALKAQGIRPTSYPSRCFSTATSDEKYINLATSLKYCQDIVHTKYPHMTHIINQTPESVRPLQFGLLALFHELEEIPEQAKNQDMALLRMMWWRSSVETVCHNIAYEFNPELFEDQGPPEVPPANPVIHVLSNAIRHNGLGFDFGLLNNILDVHERWISRVQYPSLPDLIRDIDNYYGSYFHLVTNVGAHVEANAEEAQDLSQAIAGMCILLGRAYGLTRVLQTYAYGGVRGHLAIPEDILHYYGLYLDDLRLNHSEILHKNSFDYYQEHTHTDTYKAHFNQKVMNPDMIIERPDEVNVEQVREGFMLTCNRLMLISNDIIAKIRANQNDIPKELRKYFTVIFAIEKFNSKLTNTLKDDVLHPNFQYLDPKELLSLQLSLANFKLFKKL